jgi:hypothetical protein
MTSTDMRVRVLLSVQRELLGHIGTAVRAITCRWTEDEIHVRVVFNGEISDDDAEAISEAETEVIADFPSQIASASSLNAVIVRRRSSTTLMSTQYSDDWKSDSNEGPLRVECGLS